MSTPDDIIKRDTQRNSTQTVEGTNVFSKMCIDIALSAECFVGVFVCKTKHLQILTST